jgi:signal peptidase I
MKKYQKGLLGAAVALVALGLILRVLLFKVWTVPDEPRLGAAVAPTLAGGDVVVVLTRGKPGFGDLVRCADPEDPQKYVIGRIAGVAYDVVETEAHRLIVNGKKFDAGTACPEKTFHVPHPTTGSDVELRCDVIEMGGGWHYRGFSPKSFMVTTTRTEVTPGMVYLLSDNREHHDDSRDFGLVPSDSCTERIIFRLWSKDGWGDDKRRLTYIH